MATKARHLKAPGQLWVADNRKRLGLTPADLATLTGVSIDTARGWESRGRPSEDAIGILERRFGVAFPRDEQAGGSQAELIAALRDHTAALDRQTARMADLLEAMLGGGAYEPAPVAPDAAPKRVRQASAP